MDQQSDVFRRADASARLLRHLFCFWRQGRGEPVDRAVLEESEAVSDVFIDEVSQLAASLCEDGRRLIDELRAGRIARFRNDRIEALEVYFEEHGYLDNRPIFDADEIRDAVIPLVFDDCENGLLSRERIDHLLALVMGDQSARGRAGRSPGCRRPDARRRR